MGHTVSLGRGRRPRLDQRPVGERRYAALQALTASGVVPTYDYAMGGRFDAIYADLVVEAGFTEFALDVWPTAHESLSEQENAHALARDGGAALLRLEDGTLALFSPLGGFLRVRVAAATQTKAYATLAAFRVAHPLLTLENNDGEEMRVPITFWTNGSHGPVARMRMIGAQPWEDISGNYPGDVRDQLDELMTNFKPGSTGQLLLMQGPPGTGKTYVLRALASAWDQWAEFHYITDPDSFFVDNPIYMIDVLLSDSYGVYSEVHGGIVEEQEPEAKWKVLLLEDTGELLSANAKEKYGQGLSRLLNVVDGMIGQGLKVLCVVTTNDELGDLNPAVLRPGRCASQIMFRTLTPEEAAEWAGEDVDGEVSLAELYAKRGNGKPALNEDDDELTAAANLTSFIGLGRSVAFASESFGLTAAATDVVDAIREVAALHQDAAEGYGQTAWNPDTRTVLYVAGDWTDADPIEEAMLAIDGVDHFDCEFEGLPDDWCAAQIIYPENVPATSWVVKGCDDTETALDDVVALAAQPIVPERRELIATAVVEDPFMRLISERAAASDTLALRAVDALAKMAGREQPAQPSHHYETHMHLPAHDLRVNVEPTDVSVEPHSHVTVEGAKVEPRFEVTVPEREVHVEVHPAEVHVAAPEASEPEIHVHVAGQERRAVRVDYDSQGRKVYVPIELEEEAER